LLPVIDWARGGWLIFRAIPLCIFAYSCQVQVVPTFFELNKPFRNRQSFFAITAFVVGLCAVLYLATGIFGYYLFGPKVRDNVLLSFDNNSDYLAVIAKLFMAIHVALAAPVMIFPARRLIRQYALTCVLGPMTADDEDDDQHSVGQANGDDDEHDEDMGYAKLDGEDRGGPSAVSNNRRMSGQNIRAQEMVVRSSVSSSTSLPYASNSSSSVAKPTSLVVQHDREPFESPSFSSSAASSSSSSPEAANGSATPAWLKRRLCGGVRVDTLIQSTLVVLLAAVIAVLVPQVEVVFGLLGATGGVVMV
jgi:hypothetical protein